MAMTSKHRLTSKDDIELRVVVKFRVGIYVEKVNRTLDIDV